MRAHRDTRGVLIVRHRANVDDEMKRILKKKL